MIGDAIATLLSEVLTRVFPDPAQKAQAALELAKMQQAGEFKTIDAAVALASAQTDVNRAEAASGDLFTSRWRPFIGWVCGVAFAWNWIGLPLAMFACELLAHPVTLRAADMSEMMPVLLGLLGLGALRSFEKAKGVA